MRRALGALAVFGISLALQRWLEVTHRSDSVGWWYAVYCASIFTLTIVLASLWWGFIWRALRRV